MSYFDIVLHLTADLGLNICPCTGPYKSLKHCLLSLPVISIPVFSQHSVHINCVMSTVSPQRSQTTMQTQYWIHWLRNVYYPINKNWQVIGMLHRCKLQTALINYFLQSLPCRLLSNYKQNLQSNLMTMHSKQNCMRNVRN